MTGTGAFDFAVLGSPTVLRHTDRLTFSQPSDSSSSAGSKDSHVSPLSSPKRSPVKAPVATAVAEGSESTLSIAAISSSEYGLVSVPFGANAGISAIYASTAATVGISASSPLYSSLSCWRYGGASAA
jgi:hypothetical protein